MSVERACIVSVAEANRMHFWCTFGSLKCNKPCREGVLTTYERIPISTVILVVERGVLVLYTLDQQAHIRVTVNKTADPNRTAATYLTVQRPLQERFGDVTSAYWYSFKRYS